MHHLLVDYAAALPPGVALDVGCDDGAGVVWLAERGWRATGADASELALSAARRRAGEAGVLDRTTWVQVDLEAGDVLPGGHDLVTATTVGVPEEHAERVLATIAGAVRLGGTLLVAGEESHRVTRVLGEGWISEVADGLVVARREDA